MRKITVPSRSVTLPRTLPSSPRRTPSALPKKKPTTPPSIRRQFPGQSGVSLFSFYVSDSIWILVSIKILKIFNIFCICMQGESIVFIMKRIASKEKK